VDTLRNSTLPTFKMALRIALVLALSIALATAVPRLGFSGAHRQGKIVGGVEAKPHSHPSIVSIQVYGSQYCGGSIVNENYIVTAAHCATRAASDYSVVAGEHDLNSVDGVEQTVLVSEVIQHPDYNAANSRHDIAVFKLATPLVLDENVAAANLAPKGFTPEQTLKAIGWGTTTENGDIPDKLQEVDVPFHTDAACRLNYALIAYIFEDMICAGEGGHDSCQGDSGGPLTSTDADGKVTLVGVTSFGVGCARPRYPGVYTEVSFFSEWVASVTGSA